MSRNHNESLDEYVEEVQRSIDRKEEGIYSARVLQEARNPKNVGRIEFPDGAAKFKGPCGDTMEVSLRVDDDMVSDINFFTDGCGPSVACGSMLTQMAMGRTLEAAGNLSEDELLEALGGLPDESAHCAELAVTTLRMALDNLGQTPKSGGAIRNRPF